MSTKFSRRRFLKGTAAVAVAAPLVSSGEEYRLLAAEPAVDIPAATGSVPTGKIGSVTMSRVICGGNLISGYAHSRDLIYVSKLLKSYFTEAKIMETWQLCEAQGVNTMIFNPTDQRALRIYTDYKKRGGKIQCLAQVLSDVVERALDARIGQSQPFRPHQVLDALPCRELFADRQHQVEQRAL